MPTKNWLFDEELIFEDGAAALTSVGDNIGSKASHDLGNAVVQPGTLMIADTSAIDTTTGDETYLLIVEGSNDSFSTPVRLQSLEILAIGRTYLPFYNRVGAVVFRDIRINVFTAGTTPIITLKVFLTGPAA